MAAVRGTLPDTKEKARTETRHSCWPKVKRESRHGKSLTEGPISITGTMQTRFQSPASPGKPSLLLSHIFFSTGELLFPRPRKISSAADYWELEKWFINFPLAFSFGTWLYSTAVIWLLGLVLPGVSWCLEPLFFTQVYIAAVYRIVSVVLGAIFYFFGIFLEVK